MRKHIRFYIAALTLLLGVSSIFVAPAAVFADTPQTAVCGALGSSSDCSSKPANGIDLNDTVTAVVNILSVIVGVASVIMIIIGGFRFVTSNGDSNSVSSARSTVIYAIIGLLVVAMAQFIVQFVLHNIT